MTQQHSPRRCEHSAEIMRIRDWLQLRGYRILNVTPIGVVASRGLGQFYCYTPDDRAPTPYGPLADGPVRDGMVLPRIFHTGGVVSRPDAVSWQSDPSKRFFDPK